MLSIIDPPSKKNKIIDHLSFSFFGLQVTQLGKFLLLNYRCGIQIHLYQKLIDVLV